MGNTNDKFLSDSAYQRSMNAFECVKRMQLLTLEDKIDAHQQRLDREKVEIKRAQAKAQFELDKAELILQFQADVRKAQAELSRSRSETQTSLFEKFVDYMNKTLDINTTLVDRQKNLYALIASSTDPKKVDYFMTEAEKIKVLDAQTLMAVGLEKIKELNLENSEEIRYLQSKLEKLAGTLGHTSDGEYKDV